MGVFSGAFNSAAFGERTRGFRVLFASAVLSASAVAEAEPWRITPAAADAVGQTEVVPPYAWARRAGNARIFPLATFDRTRPWDLLTGEFAGRSVFEPEPLVTRAGLADGQASMSFDPPDPLVFAFYADLAVSAQFDPIHSVVYRPGAAELRVAGSAEAEPYRIRRSARVAAAIVASASAVPYRIAGGAADLDVPAYLFAEGHLNGVQPGWSELHVRSALDNDPTRVAGGGAFADVIGLWGGDPIPGRGAEVEMVMVNATLEAVWWTFTYEQAELSASASVEAKAANNHAASAEMLQGSAMVTAQWSRIVEPQQNIVAASATARAEPWRITPARADGRVRGSVLEDGRVALRGTIDARVEASLTSAPRLALRGTAELLPLTVMRAVPWRITPASAESVAVASILRARASVNITNDAPDWRNLVVPEENRVLSVPYENRTMVVS